MSRPYKLGWEVPGPEKKGPKSAEDQNNLNLMRIEKGEETVRPRVEAAGDGSCLQ